MWGDQRGSSEESLKSKVACSNFTVTCQLIMGLKFPALKHAP